MVLGVLSTQPPVDRVVFKNNIVSESLVSIDLWIQWLTHEVDHNDYFEPSGAGSVAWQGMLTDRNDYLAISGHDARSITGDPRYLDAAAWDFRIEPGSPCVDAGDFLRRTAGSGTGTAVPVEDARYFSDGMGLVPGDAVRVGANGEAAVIAVDYAANVVTADRSLSCVEGDGVGYAFEGVAPDIGAYEVPAPTGVPAPPLQRSSLSRNIPNPFKPTTTISFSLAAPGEAELIVYDLAGREVRRLSRGHFPAGVHDVVWDGRDDLGREAGSGLYFYKLRVGGRDAGNRKALLLK